MQMFCRIDQAVVRAARKMAAHALAVEFALRHALRHDDATS